MMDPIQILLAGLCQNGACHFSPKMMHEWHCLENGSLEPEKITQLAWTPWGKVKLVKAKFPDSAALYGADYLCRSSLSN